MALPHSSKKDPYGLKAVLPLVMLSCTLDMAGGERKTCPSWGEEGSGSGEKIGARRDFLTGVEVWK